MIMGNNKKLYVGAIDSEQEAAVLYDQIAILTNGLKVLTFYCLTYLQAKTNYSYNSSQILEFLSDSDLANLF